MKKEVSQIAQPCPVPRWLQLKATLNNLQFREFFEQATTDANAAILDVRTKEEFLTGSLPGAININYLSIHLADELEALQKDKTYYVFCGTSRRSIRICIILKNAGFKQIFNLDTGLQHRSITNL